MLKREHICFGLATVCLLGVIAPTAGGQVEDTPRLSAVIASYLASHDLNYAYDAEKSVFHLRLELPAGNVQFAIITQEDDRLVRVVSLLPIRVARDRVPAAAEYLSRANFGLPVGNFELDYDDGRIRFKTSLDVSGGVFVPEMFHQMMAANIASVMQYSTGLQDVVTGTKSPKVAVQEAESEKDVQSPGTEDRPTRKVHPRMPDVAVARRCGSGWGAAAKLD